MSRLIDADALIAETKGNRCADCDRRKGIKRGKTTFVYEFGEAPCRACDVGDMIDTLDEAPTVGGWISVKDRMPEENEAVNIVWKNTEPVSYYEHIKGKPFVATGVYFRGKWYWWSSVVQDYLVEYGNCEVDEMDKAIAVTHWMPLPSTEGLNNDA